MLSFNQSKQLIILIVIAIIAVTIGVVAYKSKGRWVCKDNLWVAEGNPNGPKPGIYCK